MQIKFKCLSPKAVLPQRQTAGSAGYDLTACLDGPLAIGPGEAEMVPLGIAGEIPQGYAGFVFSRSGLGAKQGLVVAQGVGVIDSDYRGEWLVPIRNLGREAKEIAPGQRIAQVVFLAAAGPDIVEVEALSQTGRGGGGFGSTGGQGAGA